MSQEKIEVIGYHTTNKKHVNSILKEGFILSENTEDKKHWLGDGIYLFKYPLDAKAWGLKIDNCKDNPVTIRVEALVGQDNILDLDNPAHMHKLKDFTEKVYKKVVRTNDIDFNNEMELMSLGINLYRKAFNIDLTSYTFNKSMARGQLDLNDFTYNLFRRKPRRGFNIAYDYKQVQYCLKDNSKIIDKKVYQFQE